MSRGRKIPFDARRVAAIVHDLQAWLGAAVQDVRHTAPGEFQLELYRGEVTWLHLNVQPSRPRLYLATRFGKKEPARPPLLEAMRARLLPSRMVRAETIGADRMVRLDFETPAGPHTLIVELTGKHANLVLLEASGRIVAAEHFVPRSKSVRPVTPGSEYTLPPLVDPDVPALSGDYERAYLVPGAGVLLAPDHEIPPEAVPQTSASVAAEKFFTQSTLDDELTALRSRLRKQLDRERDRAEFALRQLREGVVGEDQTARWIRDGELLMAYQPVLIEGASETVVTDYDGSLRTIPIDPTLTARENAERWFRRARKARERRTDLLAREAELARQAEVTLRRAATPIETMSLADLKQFAAEHLSITSSREAVSGTGVSKPRTLPAKVREVTGPRGIRVRYGENAEANDWLTTKGSKPNDWWLHVRGATSAHVVIETQNQPNRIGPDQFEFAARIAVHHSKLRQSRYVPVDICLRKYVRKPRGAPAGSVQYSHERTIHIEPDGKS